MKEEAKEMYQIADEELILEVTEKRSGDEISERTEQRTGVSLVCGRKVLEAYGAGVISAGGKIPRQ